MAGFQSFVNGTSFDAVNAMSYNFIADVATITGSGSKTYSLAGFNLSAAIIGGRTSAGSTQITYSVSVSGQTVSWSGVDIASKLIVTATANTTLNYAGFIYNDYSVNPPVFKIAPNFTPFNLTQVIDITPSFGQVIQTNVPASQSMIAFHRCTAASGFDHVWWTEIVQNGYWALQFRPNFGYAMTSTRIYVFSKIMVNIPPGGFFMYNNGQMVWHSNCLPLQMMTGAIVNAGQPVASTSGVSVVVSQPFDPAFPETGVTLYNCYSGGVNNSGQYEISGADLYSSANYSVPASQGRPPPYSCGPPGAIYTNIYDSYYRQALGV